MLWRTVGSRFELIDDGDTRVSGVLYQPVLHSLKSLGGEYCDIGVVGNGCASWETVVFWFRIQVDPIEGHTVLETFLFCYPAVGVLSADAAGRDVLSSWNREHGTPAVSGDVVVDGLQFTVGNGVVLEVFELSLTLIVALPLRGEIILQFIGSGGHVRSDVEFAVLVGWDFVVHVRTLRIFVRYVKDDLEGRRSVRTVSISFRDCTLLYDHGDTVKGPYSKRSNWVRWNVIAIIVAEFKVPG